MTQKSRIQTHAERRGRASNGLNSLKIWRLGGLVIVGIILVVTACVLGNDQRDIHQQQQRFNTIRPVLQDFQVDMRQ
jgi:hypothetical protein